MTSKAKSTEDAATVSSGGWLDRVSMEHTIILVAAFAIVVPVVYFVQQVEAGELNIEPAEVMNLLLAALLGAFVGGRFG